MLQGLVIGGVSVLIGADASGLVKEAKSAEAQMKQLERTTSNIVHRMKTAILALAGPAAMMALTKSSLDLVDQQYKLAKQLGGTTDSMQVLVRVADLAGVSQDELAGAMGRLNRKIGEALRDGVSPAADAFKRLGLNAKELSGLNVDQRVAVIGQKLQEAGYNAQQTADWLGQIGIRGGKMAALFQEAPSGLAEARKELEKFGVLLNDVDAKSIENANDAMSIFGVAVRGVGNQLAFAASVIMPKVAAAFKDWGMQGDGAGKIWEKVIDEIVVGLGVIPTIVHTVRVAWDALMDFIVGSLNMFATGWNATLGKVLFELGTIQNEFGNASKNLEKPPNMEEWSKMWQKMKQERREAMADAPDKNRPDVDTSSLSSKEQKALEAKLEALKRSVAAEDEVLALQMDKQMKDLDEFYKKKLITQAQYKELQAQIEEDYDKKIDDLKWTRLESGIATEQEILRRKYEQQLALLQEFKDNETYTVEEAERIKAGIQADYQQKSLQAMAASYSGLANVVDTAMGAITDIVGQEGKKGFTIMKAISMATALVKGFEATVSAFATGEKTGIPGMGFVMAGIAAAGTAAIIAKLAGVNPGSGGSTAGATGGVGNTASAQAPTSPSSEGVAPERTLLVQGFNRKEFFSGDMVRDIAENLLEFQRDGGRVILEDK